jgi:hypothetical protein
MLERPRHYIGQQPPGRQHQQHIAAGRRHEAQLRTEREISVDDAGAKLNCELLPVAGRSHVDAVDLGLLRTHELRLQLGIAGKIAGRQHHAAARTEAPRA